MTPAFPIPSPKSRRDFKGEALAPVLSYGHSMRRRDLLTALTAAGFVPAADHPEAGSLYIPKAHLVEDRTFLHDFMDEYSFVDLITSQPTLRITHIPCFLQRTSGQFGSIFGHISRNNVQSQAFDGKQSAVIVFRGPHSYISPSWYSKSEAVPTWNFGVVHATGKLKPVAEKPDLHKLLARLIKKFENRYGGSSYDFEKLPENYVNGMLGGIIGFEMEIERLEGKFKLGQERGDADKAGILSHLGEHKEASMKDFTAAFYARVPKA